MNRNEKENTAQINIRVRPKEKEHIKRLAQKCGLTLTEYMAKRALGYEPRAVLPDVFFDCYSILCQLANAEPTPETEQKLLDLIGDLRINLILPGKEPDAEIRARLERDAVWPPQDSGPSKES